MTNRFENEQPIKLAEFFKKPEEAKAEIEAFQERFMAKKTSGNRKPIPSRIGEIKMTAIKELYEIADDIARKAGVQKKEYITAVRITHAMDLNQDEIKLFYEPIYIKKKTITTTPATFTGYIIPSRSKAREFREYKNGAFSIVQNNQIVWDTKRAYRNRIAIKRYTTGRYVGFLDRNDWTGDTKAVVFSFQELFKLYELNHEIGRQTYTFSEPLILDNSSHWINKAPTSPAQNRFKHTFLFSTKGVIPKFIGPQRGEAANLAHLCPPRCNEITYNI